MVDICFSMKLFADENDKTRINFKNDCRIKWNNFLKHIAFATLTSTFVNGSILVWYYWVLIIPIMFPDSLETWWWYKYKPFRVPCCQAQVQSQIQVLNPGPKSKSQIQNPKSWGKGLELGLTLLSYRPPTHPTTTTPNFSHLKCQSSDGKRPGFLQNERL